MGQLYVLISRVTDPNNFNLIGIPPRDLLEDVAEALLRERLDVEEYFKKMCAVTNDWQYDRMPARLRDRIKPRRGDTGIPLKFRTLHEVLNPMPDATVVIKRLLDWIDRCDLASQAGTVKPVFQTAEGEPIFPAGDEPWWLTELSRRQPEEERKKGDEDGPPSEHEEEAREVSDSDPPSEGEAPSVLPLAFDKHNPVVAWKR